MEIKLARSTEDILKCFEALHVLRPHIVKAHFVDTIKKMMKGGYVLAFIEKDGIVVSAAGYRYLHSLHIGEHYKIDDLTTLESARGGGYAGALIDYVVAQAKENGYNAVTLDSGHHRSTAHRLYLNKGFIISAHHFEKKL